MSMNVKPYADADAAPVLVQPDITCGHVTFIGAMSFYRPYRASD